MPIKRSEHLIRLSREHHSGLLFCWKIRQGLKKNADTERIKKYVEYFWHHDLADHFREEEDILFALMKDDDKVKKAFREHVEIKAQIDSITKSAAPETSRLVDLVDAVDNHIRYEERELFPYLETTFTPEQLVKIGEQLNAAPSAADNYTDEFWL
ncbi:hemerythrin domain-containing protein [Pinibacter aurantiacus]|uniref:Hemerythrin domain-containing protein n=1 Tax=Pinibacter aurantiacus TaxID=2851599 RepID=A0A9E2S8G5_9BACT|nr:hemerythrin domain-containing protein [Pinibacter aurantiacus]MBV4357522.1 hemerythrin domain-containing protein [Pinibacter aurantiacus]